MYFTNTEPHKPHLVFFGRWCPLHKGHTYIMEEMLKKKNLPLLILVRDTAFDDIDVIRRAEAVKAWMEFNNIEGSIMIIPDIEGVYYGRGVGYNVEEIKPPENITTISATKIRKMIANGDDSWKEFVAEGTANFLESTL